MILQVLLSFFLCLTFVIGYRSGPPTSACESLKPGHVVGFRTGNGSYSLSLTPNIKDGFVVVKLTTSEDPFVGFIVQARNETSGKVLGSFSGSDYRSMDCSDIKGSTVSHANRKPKTNVELKWTIPKDLPKEQKVLFKATFVKSFLKFYSVSKVIVI